MEDNHRWTLQIDRKNLVKDLNPDEIQDHIIASGIMDSDDFEKIGLGKSRKERAASFLDLLICRGPLAFRHFCDALQEKQKFLSQRLKEDAEMLAKKVGRGAKIEVDAMTLQNILRANDDLNQTKAELHKEKGYNEELQRKIDHQLRQLQRERRRSEELNQEGESMKQQYGQNIKHINTLLEVVSEKSRQQDEGERDVQGLEAELYEMEEKLNIKEETIKHMKIEKHQLDDKLLQERRIVRNLRCQVHELQKDIKIMEQDVTRLRGDRNAARRAADTRGEKIHQLQRELMITNQMRRNCESVIRHVNESRTQEVQQAKDDLSVLLRQYLNLKQKVCS